MMNPRILTLNQISLTSQMIKTIHKNLFQVWSDVETTSTFWELIYKKHGLKDWLWYLKLGVLY